MSDLSLFLDESGSDNLRDTYYILALVVHDQADALADNIVRYEFALREKGLPDVPFHATPLLNGHDAYEGMGLAERKRLLSAFRLPPSASSSGTSPCATVSSCSGRGSTRPSLASRRR